MDRNAHARGIRRPLRHTAFGRFQYAGRGGAAAETFYAISEIDGAIASSDATGERATYEPSE